MKGSKTSSERINLLNQVEKIIFVSEWVQKRFFIDLDQRLINKTEVVYPSIHKQKKLLKKEKKIVFVGKLNTSKGYDIFGQAVIKILSKFNKWRAVAIGNERREVHSFKHKN